MHAPLADLVGTLRVMLDPDAAEGIDHHLVVALPTGERAGLHVRHCIACPTDGSAVDTAPTTVATLDRATLAGLFAGTTTWSEERARGTVRIDGDAAAADRVVACFELAGLRG
jgi:alkyl sulfatase BDS1-like metallo-beta-lactamase superfamily hydrolase